MTNETFLLDALKWDVRQRLRLLESTLLLTGWVRTQALCDAFGISRAQASKDFAVYMALRPDNLIYNKSRKYYEASSDFLPLLLSGKTSELLNALSVMPTEEGTDWTLAAYAPSVAMLRPMEREIDLKVFRAISQAVYNQRKLRLMYQSMNRPEPAEHVISPHTLVFSGFRWHVRGLSDGHGEYRDFVLARVRGQPEVLEEDGVDARDDALWQEQVEVIIAPHPDLPQAQQQVLAEDYGMTHGRSVQTMRAALVPYFLRLMQIEPGREHPDPKVQQIVLVNQDALGRVLW